MIYPAIKKAAISACMLLFCLLAFAQPGILDKDYYSTEAGGYNIQKILPLPDSTFLLGGDFTYINNVTAGRIAKVKADGSHDPSFQTGTGFNGIVYCLALQADGKIVVGGNFTSYNGTSCIRIARLNGDGSLDTGFNTGAGFNGVVRDLLVEADGKIMAGGVFSSYRGSTIYGSARIKTDGHRDSTYSASASVPGVYSLAKLADGKYLFAGAYTASFKNLRRVNANGSADTTFNAGGSGPNSHIYKMSVLSSGRICIAGAFTQYNGSAAVRGMVVDTNGTAYVGFSAGTGFNAFVNDIYEQANGKLIFSGDFTSYNGTSINRIVRTDATGARDTTFKPGSGFDDVCQSLAPMTGGRLMAGGQFMLYNTYSRPGIAILDSTGALKHDVFGNTGLNGQVRAIAKQSDGSTIVGGDFTRFGERAVGRIIRVDSKGDLDTTFNAGSAGANAGITAVHVLPDDKVLVGGSFTQFNGSTRTRLALLNADGSLNGSFTIAAGSTVRRIRAGAGGKIYVMGQFNTLGGQTRKGIGRLNSDLTLDNAVAPGTQINTNVFDVAEQPDGKLVLAGNFATYGDTATFGIVRIDTLGNRDTSFHTGSGLYVNGGAAGNALHLQGDGKIVVGGIFTQYNGTIVSGIIRLLANGRLDTSYHATIPAANTIYELQPYRNSLIAGGFFATANGVSRNGIACFDSTGTLDPKVDMGTGLGGLFSPGIYAIHNDTYAGRILVGGKFAAVQDINKAYYAGLTAEFLDAAIDSVKIDTLLCAGGTTNVTFKKLKGFNTGNVFNMQMSDSAGNFASPVVIGSKTSNGSGWESVSVTIPSGTAVANGYKVRVVSTKAISTSGVSNIFKIDSLTPPGAPTSQTVCSDTAYTFVFDSILTNADSIEWALDSAFLHKSTIVKNGSISITTAVNYSNKLFLRGKSAYGCLSETSVSVLSVRAKPLSPVVPAPKRVISDTAHTFTLSDIKLTYGGNLIEWATDSLFSNVSIDTPGFTINLTVAPDSFALLYFKTTDTIGGCTSAVFNTIMIVDSVKFKTIEIDAIIPVCMGDSASIFIPASISGKKYELTSDGHLLDAAYGNSGTLTLHTNSTDSFMVLDIMITDTLTHTTTRIDTTIAVKPYDAVDTVLFTQGELLVAAGDTACYTAVANHGSVVRYSILYGGATIDSVTGCISNITDTFTIKAIIYGLNGCSYSFGTLHVDVTDIAMPTIPESQTAFVDSIDGKSFVFDSIYAGLGADQIEWATNENFDSSTIVASPATIELDLIPTEEVEIWIRSRNYSTGKVSKAAIVKATLRIKLLSAGLLDKSKWEKNLQFSDEFDYSTNSQVKLPLTASGFMSKWALNFCWSWNPDPCNEDCIGNHAIIATNSAGQLYAPSKEFSNINRDGSGGEITFSDRKMIFRTEKLGATYYPYADYPSTIPCPSETFQNIGYTYKAPLMSSNPFEFNMKTIGLFEIRMKGSGEIGAWPAFWLFGSSTEYDILENQIESSRYVNYTSSTIHDFLPDANTAWPEYSEGGQVACARKMWKITDCSFTEDWHTYSFFYSPDKIIFFVDGKETWSHDQKGNDYPKRSNGDSVRVILGMAAFGSAELYQTEIDYFHFYTPKANNTNPAICLMDVQAGQAKTFESPNFVGTNNNVKDAYVANTLLHVTQMVAPGNMAIEHIGNSPKIYYSSTKNICYNYYKNGASWYEFPLTNGGGIINDVKGDLTFYRDGHLYYQSKTGNKLKFFYWINSLQKWFNFETGVTNCKSDIVVDDQGIVSYIGTDGNIYSFVHTNAYSGFRTQVTYDGMAKDGLTIADCGCLLFYRDINNKAKQLYWWGNWHALPAPISDITLFSSDFSIDEANGLLYFVGADQALRSYEILYSQINTHNDALRRIGYETCENGVLGDMTLNKTGDKIYFSNVDYRLEKVNTWYYFNDKEYGSVKTGNWNKTCLVPTATITDKIVLDDISMNRIFYRGAHKRLKTIDLVDADNVLNCPDDDQVRQGNHFSSVYKNEGQIEEEKHVEIRQIEKAESLSLQVYPNPSNNTFTFLIDNSNLEVNFAVEIYNIDGKLIYSHFENGQELVWDASKIVSGVYFYRVSIDNGQVYNGKLVKL